MSFNDLQYLGENITSTGPTDFIKIRGKAFTFTIAGHTSSGSGSALVHIEGSNMPQPTENGDWQTLYSVSLTLGPARTSDGYGVNLPWDKVRARVETLSGSGAKLLIYTKER